MAMSRTKYRQYIKQMYTEHSAEFADFKLLHDLYATDKKRYQEKYNKEGIVIKRIIEDWESRLCNQMESGNNASYSAKLAEAFHTAIKKDYPLIEFIGVKRI